MFLIKPEAVFLDFDGVVVESTAIKTDAFYELYKPFGEDIALMAKEYHLEHQGITRAVKFREMHQRFLGKECSENEQIRLSQAFTKFVFEEILKCPLVEGVTEFLEKNQKNNIPVFLMSATPDEELRRIVDQRGLSPYFIEIHGAPRTKVDIGRDLLGRYAFNKNQVVFIGDSISDYQASREIQTHFIGRQIANTPVVFQDVPVIHTFQELI